MKSFFDLEPAREEAERNQAPQYAAFEAAIELWEARTGLRIERAFGEGNTYYIGKSKCTEYTGNEWKNFAKFLGSRECRKYRDENGIMFEQAVAEWQKMGIE